MSHYTKYRYVSERSSEHCGDRTRQVKSKLMGVCAGLANQFGWDIYTLRAIALLGLFLVSLPTIAIYVFLGVVFY